MSLSAAVIRELVRAGLSGDALADACQRIEDAERAVSRDGHVTELEARRASDRARKARQRQMSRDVTGRHVTPPSEEKVSPGPPSKTQPTPIPPSPPKGGSPPKPTPKGELLAVLDEERAQAVVDHRQRIGKPLTQRAGKLLAGKFAQCPDPNEAADAMIANGWQGFEPQWLDNRTSGPGPPANGRGRRRDMTDLWLDLHQSEQPDDDDSNHPQIPS